MRARNWCVLCIGFLASTVGWATQQPIPRLVAPRGELAADEKATIDVFRRMSPSVVYITTLDKVMNLWTRNIQDVPRGTGSGFIWDDRGHVVTNYHVVADAGKAQVRLSDQRSYEATLVGVSPEYDLAVLRIKVPNKKPAPLPMGSSADLLVGQRVIAIGNPFGFDHTLTVGVISALDRAVQNDDGGVNFHLIQTDAAINPGNSGGPLLDSAGRLIGVNTQIYSPSGASAGIGFAIPADTVNRVVPEIIAFGQFRRPSLGLSVNDRISDVVTARLGIKGLLIMDVRPGFPAALAGLRGSRMARDGSVMPGDVILTIDGKAVDNASTMDSLLDAKRIGEEVTLRLWREGASLQVTLTLAAPRPNLAPRDGDDKR